MSGGARITASGWGWRHAGRKRWAVRDVSVTIEPGERVLLLGASGSGKSTLLSGLAGLLGGADEGETVGELVVDGRRPEEQRGRIGLVLQDPDSQVVLARVGDDVAFGCENLGVARDEIWRRVSHALDSVGLDLPLEHETRRLSGGQKQRLALAGVLAMQPSLLLLDEPTANLDPVGVEEVRDAVARVVAQTEATLIVVEHRTPVWVDLMTRVIVLDADGGVLADGAPADVFGRTAAALAAAGVWVPGALTGLPPAPTLTDAAAVLATEGLAVGRAPRGRRSRGAVASTRPAGAVQWPLDLAIPHAASTVVLGPNGAGKSTLALTLAGLLAPLAGRVVSESDLGAKSGRSPHDWTSRDLLTRIGSVFQDPEHQFLATTVHDELAVGPRRLGWAASDVDRRVGELLDRLDLAALAGANPFTLSGGQKRRLSVATVLASRPRVMVLDEPTFGQDRVSWISLVELLQAEIDRGTTLISVTHDAGVVEHLGTNTITLDVQIAERAAA
ncbi:energy-coupling factor ABC transporter ATP-binding protein [Agromyces atrinae]|nr:energy-coupling factor ABC transporter ATP-binding protein [Agromyces atrinae]